MYQRILFSPRCTRKRFNLIRDTVNSYYPVRREESLTRKGYYKRAIVAEFPEFAVAPFFLLLLIDGIESIERADK